MHSARLAAEVFLAGGTSQTYQRALARDVGRQVGRATWLSRALVRGWAQALTIQMVLAYPRAMSLAASGTRIPLRALKGVANAETAADLTAPSGLGTTVVSDGGMRPNPG